MSLAQSSIKCSTWVTRKHVCTYIFIGKGAASGPINARVCTGYSRRIFYTKLGYAHFFHKLPPKEKNLLGAAGIHRHCHSLQDGTFKWRPQYEVLSALLWSPCSMGSGTGCQHEEQSPCVLNHFMSPLEHVQVMQHFPVRGAPVWASSVR